MWLAEPATIGADFYSTAAYGHLSWSPPVTVVHRMLRDIRPVGRISFQKQLTRPQYPSEKEAIP